MPRGGARVNSGPPPDPNALRRERPSDKDSWVDLPAEGRAADAPAFPLLPYRPRYVQDRTVIYLAEDEAFTDREMSLWVQLWRTPVSLMWERLGWSHEVALYTRQMVLAEMGDPKSMAEARQWSDRLGLNPAAMLRLHWRVAPDVLAARRGAFQAAGKAAAGAGSDMRDRLKAVNGGDA